MTERNEIVWGASDTWEALHMAMWCAEQIWPGQGKSFGSYTTMGVVRGERLIAVMVFHNWDPNAEVIEVSGAAVDKRWIDRHTLHEMFAYCFEQVGVQTVVMRVSPDDRPLHRMLTTYGFKSHRLPRLRGRHRDELLFTLHDDDWKQNKFEANHGQEESARAA